MQKQIRSFDGTKINYEIENISENCVVFLHGLGSTLTVWKKPIDIMHKNNISTIAIDMRGHGLSERPKYVYDYEFKNFAKDVHHILQKENIKNFVLVGHCVGGAIAVTFHKMYPDLAKAYVLISSTYKYVNFSNWVWSLKKMEPLLVSILNQSYFTKNNGKLNYRDYKKYIGTGDWNVRRLYTDIMNTGLKSFLCTLQNFMKYNEMETLTKITKPVLLMNGSKDSIVSLGMARRMKSLIKNSKLIVLPEEDHIVVLNNPTVVGKNILEFAKSLPDFIQKRNDDSRVRL
jgi:pimeloyl-ACP methyl ester carboxylesterase